MGIGTPAVFPRLVSDRGRNLLEAPALVFDLRLRFWARDVGIAWRSSVLGVSNAAPGHRFPAWRIHG